MVQVVVVVGGLTRKGREWAVTFLAITFTSLNFKIEDDEVF